MPAPRTHEWAWGDVGRRTVCGMAGFGVRGRSQLARLQIVSDLGAIARERRCGNCERMRATIGASSRPVAAEPSAEAAELAAAAAVEGVASDVSARELEIMTHATGWDSRWPLFRNHFCASEGQDGWSEIQRLIEAGLMRVSRKPSELSGGDTVFCVTAIGIAALKGRGKAAAAGSEQPGQ